MQKLLTVAVVVFVIAVVEARASPGLDLPSIPEQGQFVQDYAGLLDARTLERIEPLQRIAYEKHDVPIIVVTIRSMTEYGGEGWPIHYFARQWFDHWEISKRDERGRLYNKGILFLTSRGDREVRIELGAEWERRWDEHAQRIIDQVIVPEFEHLDFDTGTLAGVDALAHMAELGPHGEPPARVGSIWNTLDESPWMLTPFSLATVLFLFGGGTLLLVAGWLIPKQRRILLIAGMTLIAAGALLWALIAIVALFYMVRASQDGGDWGGGFGGGFGAGGGGGAGFGGGGFSGGGGASGSF